VDDYDDDGLDDNYDEEDYGEGEDELSPEDRAAMTHGTAEVKKAMGQDFAKVTLKQVEDALWHYYYDVDKSVAYLKKTYVTPQPQPPPKPAPKKMPEGMSTMLLYSDPSALPAGQSWADQQRSAILGTKLGYEGNWAPSALENFPIMTRPHLPLDAYFTDMPWLNVPQDRQAIFIAPSRPRGGLLGGGEGGPPLSKLQLLAAARKKKSEEKKEKEKGKAESIDHDISKLSLAGEKQKENTKLATPLAKRQKLSALPETTQTPAVIPSKDSEVETVAAANSAASIPPPVTDQAPPETDVSSVVQKASPSAFARTLFGSAPDSKKRKTRDVFPMPYTSSASYSPGVFSEPSPDDIVLAAQAKGSNFARTS
jgi:elongation factor 1 alpha-like protein